MEEQHQNFVAAVTKWEILAATNQIQGEKEREWKKVKKNTYDIFPIKIVTKIRRFWTFHVVVVQNNGKEMYNKGCRTCKVAFLPIRPIVFHRSRCLRRLALNDFIFCLNKLLILWELLF